MLFQYRPTIVIDNFYDDPMLVRKYALNCDYYYYGESASAQERKEVSWLSSFREQRYFQQAVKQKFEAILSEKIDESHWYLGTLWNGTFQCKLDNSKQGIHNHAMNIGNGCGSEGWTAIVFLSPNPKPQSGLHIFTHKFKSFPDDEPFFIDFDMDSWNVSQSFLNVFNRVVIMPSVAYHSGDVGWGDSMEEARLIQTFFFKGEGRSSFDAPDYSDMERVIETHYKERVTWYG